MDQHQGDVSYTAARDASVNRVGEARFAYLINEEDEPELHVTTKLSTKNQITLPVAMVRSLALRAGDEIDLKVEGDMIQIERRPKTPQEWIQRLRGTMAHVPEWQSKDRIDAWTRSERESWEREWDRGEKPS